MSCSGFSRMLSIGFIVFVSWLVTVPVQRSRGATINVPADQPTIQAAVNAASSGDVIRLADGTYSGPGNIDVDPGGKDLLIQASGGASNCSIDCQDSSRAFYIHSGETSAFQIDGIRFINGNHYDGGGAIYVTTSSHPVISNCEFINCYAQYYGGAIYVRSSSNPSITHCYFQGNTSTYGGGICTGSSSAVSISSCLFSTNTAAQGGGIRTNGNQPVTVTGCTFTNNIATSRGGGVCVTNNPDYQVISCVFTGNSAEFGGGINAEYATGFTMTDCQFTGNQATVYGAGARVELPDQAATISNCTFTGNTLPVTATTLGGGMLLSGEQILSSCTFMLNEAYWGGGLAAGGGITIVGCDFHQNSGYLGGGLKFVGNYCYRDPLIQNCRFTDNQGQIGGGAHMIFDGGYPTYIEECVFSGNEAVSVGGATYCDEGTSHFSNTIFHNNATTVSDGGAVFIDSGYSRFYNCLWYQNVSNAWGGALFTYSGTTELYNCTLTDNMSSPGNGRQVTAGYLCQFDIVDSIVGTWTGMQDVEVMDEDGNGVTVSYSNIRESWPGTGNISQNPLFATGTCEHGAFYLSAVASGQGNDSPCLDTGSATAAGTGYPLYGTMFTMDERVTQTNNVFDSGQLDMGYHYPICLAVTPTPTVTATPTITVTPSVTPSPSVTATSVPTETPTSVPTETPTQVATVTPTLTPVPTETPTQPPLPVPSTRGTGLCLLLAALTVALICAERR